MRQRFIVSVIAGPIALVAVWVGGWPFFVLISAALLLGMRELFSMSAAHDAAAIGYVGLIATLAGILLARERAILAAAVWIFIALMIQQLVRRSRAGLSGVVWTLFSWIYLGVLGGHFLLVRGLVDGRFLFLFGLTATWAFDITAFLFGRRWGRRRLCPEISPGKSVEGFLAGTVAAVAVAVLLSSIGPSVGALGAFGPQRACALGLAVAVAAQAGDLSESLIKRAAGVKDSGTILPGHGGILDRIDSLLFVMPILYYLAG